MPHPYGFSAYGSIKREDAIVLFRRAVAEVWGQHTADLVTLSLVEGDPSEGSFASVAQDRSCRQVAIDDHLIRYCREYKLRVSPAFLELDDETIRRVLIHEAVHLGYPNHGREFRALVAKKGGVISGRAVEDGSDKIQVQRKVGSRFKTFATVDTEAEGMALMRAEHAKDSGRYRMMF
jgi:hypothetical protein